MPTLQAGIIVYIVNPGLTTWAIMLRPFRAYLAAQYLPYTKPLLGILPFRACKLGCGSPIQSSFIVLALHKLYARTASPSNLPFPCYILPLSSPFRYIPLTLHPHMRLSRRAYFYNPLFYAYVSTIWCRNEVPLWSNAGFGRFVFVPSVWPFVKHSDHFKPYYAATGRRFLTGHAF